MKLTYKVNQHIETKPQPETFTKMLTQLLFGNNNNMKLI